MNISKLAIHRFYNATKIYQNALNAMCSREKHPRRLLRRREFNKVAKEWRDERLLFAQNTEPRFEYVFADLFRVFYQFRIGDIETIYDILARMGFKLVD